MDKDGALRSDDEIAAYMIGPVTPFSATIELAAYDPGWPRAYAIEEARIRQALGDRVLVLEHVGSTSVPGLSAKPRIDILLAVADTADEPSYVPDLEAAGYVLRIREPDWYEHRMFGRSDAAVNLHVLSPSTGAEEIDRMLLFRDHLRTSAEDRARYQRAKQELAGKTWRHVQHYADAKTAVVGEIIARARAARSPTA